jgi:hypothetical protein
MDEFYKEMSQLYFDLSKATGFDALDIGSEIQKRYSDRIGKSILEESDKRMPSRAGCHHPTKDNTNDLPKGNNGFQLGLCLDDPERVEKQIASKKTRLTFMNTVAAFNFEGKKVYYHTFVSDYEIELGHLEVDSEPKQAKTKFCPNCSNEGKPSKNKDQVCVGCLQLF